MTVAGTKERIRFLLSRLAEARQEDMSRQFRDEWDDTGSVAGPLMPVRDSAGVVGLTDPTGQVDDVMFETEAEGDPEFQNIAAVEDELRRLCGIADESLKGRQLLDEVCRRTGETPGATQLRRPVPSEESQPSTQPSTRSRDEEPGDEELDSDTA